MPRSLLLSFGTLAMVAQAPQPPEHPDALIRQWLQKALSQAIQAMPEGADPYGYALGMKVALSYPDPKQDPQPGGSMYTGLDKRGLVALIRQTMEGDQRFKRFDLKEDALLNTSIPGTLYLRGGLVPSGPKGMIPNQTAWEQSHKTRYQGQARILKCHIYLHFNTETPKDGTIAGTLSVHGRNGDIKPYRDGDWQGEAKLRVRYRRLGPGDARTNHGDRLGADSGWNHVQPSGFYNAPDGNAPMTPGHYFPSLRLRGCEVKLEHLRRDKAHEVVVAMNAETNHSDPIDEEKISPAAGSTPTWPEIPLAPNEIRPTRFHQHLKAEQRHGHDWTTPFSLGNTLKGRILGHARGTTQTVEIKPFPGLWSSEDPFTSQTVASTDGTYTFKNVPSGVYEVGVQGSRHRHRVDICNCPDKREGPNHTYEQDLEGQPEIIVALESHVDVRTERHPYAAGAHGASPVPYVSESRVSVHLVRLRSLTYLVGSRREASNQLLVMPYDEGSRLHHHTSVDYGLDLKAGGWQESRSEETPGPAAAGNSPLDVQLPEGRTVRPEDPIAVAPLMSPELTTGDLPNLGAGLRQLDALLKGGSANPAQRPKPPQATGQGQSLLGKVQQSPLPRLTVADFLAAARGSRKVFEYWAQKGSDFDYAFDLPTSQGTQKVTEVAEQIGQMNKELGNFMKALTTVRMPGERRRIDRALVLRKPTAAELKAFNAWEEEHGEQEMLEHLEDPRILY